MQCVAPFTGKNESVVLCTDGFISSTVTAQNTEHQRKTANKKKQYKDINNRT